jgi:excisionase family DNA binding protein
MSATLKPEDILTPEELAARLKVPKSWVYEKTRSRGRNQNPLPCLRLGRYIRFDWTKVVEWLTQEGDDAKRCRRR